MPPPHTQPSDVVETVHGVEVHDPYRWLEDGSSARTRGWVEAQTAHARAALDRLPGRPALERRLREALDSGTLGVTVPRGRWRFFTRRDAAMDQIALYVVEGAAESSGAADERERTLVDPGPLSPDGTTALDWWSPSP